MDLGKDSVATIKVEKARLDTAALITALKAAKFGGEIVP